MRVGIIADTHGMLRAEVLEAFRGVDRIVHAGDVGDPAIISGLEALAPLTAVHGNADGGLLRQRLPRVAELKVDGFVFVVTHGDQFGSPEPEGLRKEFPHADVIVFGHTHRSLIHGFDDWAVAVNPGTAGPARSGERPSVVVMETEPGIPPRARIVPLERK